MNRVSALFNALPRLTLKAESVFLRNNSHKFALKLQRNKDPSQESSAASERFSSLYYAEPLPCIILRKCVVIAKNVASEFSAFKNLENSVAMSTQCCCFFIFFFFSFLFFYGDAGSHYSRRESAFRFVCLFRTGRAL